MTPEQITALLMALRPEEARPPSPISGSVLRANEKQAEQLRGMLNEARQQRDKYAQELGAQQARAAKDIKQAAQAVEDAILDEVSRAGFGEMRDRGREGGLVEITARIESLRKDRSDLVAEVARLRRFEKDVRATLSASQIEPHLGMLETISRLVATASQVEKAKAEVQSIREELEHLRKLAGVEKRYEGLTVIEGAELKRLRDIAAEWQQGISAFGAHHRDQEELELRKEDSAGFK